ncbi:MAG: hypothetical protein WCP22_11450 [Chlamydiota bacterium]
MKRVKIGRSLHSPIIIEATVKTQTRKKPLSEVLANKKEELDYWYLSMMDRPDDDIAHGEFCRSVSEVTKLKGRMCGVAKAK